ncbi:MAG: choice-of-anchor J domain-containing protein [Muribaculaceae bacterium]|nr:choice-of-anchor J domain-containing protein [Muribaculaceae bacterium]
MFKKLFTLTALAFMALTANAEFSFPINYESSFSNPETVNQWTISSRDGIAEGEFSNFFATGLTPVVNLNDADFILTNNQFSGGQPSDAWLISPEFEVTDDTVMFSIQLANCGDNSAATNNSFKVLYSLDGTSKEDFEANAPLLSGTIRNRGANVISYSSQRAVIQNLKGKKIRLAFVNEGNVTGFIGFGDIMVSPYYLKIDQLDSYASLLVDNANPIVRMSMTVSTPETAKGYKAVLTTESGFTSVYEDTAKTFNIRNASSINFTFPEQIEMSSPQEKFTISFVPNFEGAIPAVISGYLIKAERKYNAVALVEEVTGTWCGWCPGGIIMMDYWRDYYKGLNGRNKVIGVALHRQDPMTMTNGTYLSDYTSQVSRAGIEVSDPPTVLVNRITGGAPLQFDMKKFFDGLKSPATLAIKSVSLDKETGKAVVKYEYTASFSASNPGFSIAAIVTEDNVTDPDDSGNWAQTNYYAQYSMAQINNQFDPEIAPYFERFVSPNPEHITDITFGEVARGIFPSFAGQPLTDEVTAEVPIESEFTFTMPDNIYKQENVNIVLVLSRRGTNEVVAADIMEAKNFKEDSGVEENLATESLFNVHFNEGAAEVNTSEAGLLTVFTIDGVALRSVEIPEGRTIIPVNCQGTLIFTLTSAKGVESVKSIVR